MGRFRVTSLAVLACAVIPHCVLAEPSPRAHVSAPHRSHPPASHLLQTDEGLSVIAAALKLEPRLDTGYDCSHLVHLVYKKAGFPYKYATAAQLYAGVGEFRRVTHPQAGDLVVFPRRGKNAHVGIMVNPAQHLFFSGLSHGPGVSSYVSPYWRARGVPHFFRYVRKAPLPTNSASLQ